VIGVIILVGGSGVIEVDGVLLEAPQAQQKNVSVADQPTQTFCKSLKFVFVINEKHGNRHE
jgi:hypothetical protein